MPQTVEKQFENPQNLTVYGPTTINYYGQDLKALPPKPAKAPKRRTVSLDDAEKYPTGKGLWFELVSTESRKGVEKDMEMIKDLVKYLGLEPEEDLIVSVNDDKIRMYNTIDKVKRRLKKRPEYQYLAIVIMAHGDTKNGQEYVEIGGREHKLSSLLENFMAKECPSLKDKPCLVFVQACRGCDVNATEVDSAVCITSPSQAPENVVPNMVDFAVVWATVEGTVALRHPEQGSYFIFNLLQAIQEDPTASFMTLFHKVARKGRQQGRMVRKLSQADQSYTNEIAFPIPSLSHYSLLYDFAFMEEDDVDS